MKNHHYPPLSFKRLSLYHCFRFLLTALLIGSPFVSSAAIVISEDFSSSASNFTAISGGTWTVNAGDYLLSSPAAGTTPGVLANISVHNTSVSGDFTLGTTVRITGTTQVWDDAAVIFGYQDANNYYYLSLNESNNTTAKGVFKVVSGSPAEIVDLSASIVSDTDHVVEIQRNGSSILVLIDGSEAASTTDSTFTSGKVGFGSYNDGAAFGDLVVTTPSGGVSLDASDGFYNEALTAAQTGVFTASFDVTPSVSPMNICVGVSDGNAYWWSEMATIVRFNTSGYIDARDGSVYSADTSIPYSGNTTYHVRMVVNVSAHTYSTYVTPSGGSEVSVGLDYDFRSEQSSISSVDTWSAVVEFASSGVAEIENFAIAQSDTQAPGVPTGLAASNVTDTTVDLDWSASTDNVGVIGYKVYINGSNPVSVSGTSVTLTDLTQNTAYTFTVSAYDAADNESGQSSGVNVTTADGEAPSVPTGLVASNVTTTAVDLDWNVSTDNVGVTGYRIYIDGSNPISVSSNSVTVTGLDPDTSYAFSVSAYDAAGNESAQNTEINVTTLASSSYVIEEDFSSSASNFSVISGGSWGVSGGRYVLSSPAAGVTPGVLENISVQDTVVSGDFTMTATFRITGTSSVWDDAALVFGFQDVDNYYCVSFNESNNETTKGIFKIVDGTPTELVDITATIVSDTDYPVEIQRSGSSIVVLLNSSQVASVSDSTFTTGRVGFGSYNDAAQFDNLVVDGTAVSQTDAPQFSPGGGTYSSAQSVAISTATSGATIRYTTDGSTPTSSSGTVYSAPVSISSTTTLKAIAYMSGLVDSSVTTATYTINTGGGANYYVDPATGSMSNSGTSLGSAWSTLQAVFAAGKTFTAGDTIYLLSGNHGFPVITGANSDDVTIARYGSETPVINRIDFDNGAAHWVVQEVDIYTSSAPPDAPVLNHPVYPKFNNTLVRVSGGSSYISLIDCAIYSIADSSGWNADNWNYLAWNGVYINENSSNILLEGCLIRNVNFGVETTHGTNNITISGCTLENFCGDGIRPNTDNMTVEYTLIRDCYNTNGNHDDAIQSTWGSTISNVVIRGNVIINTSVDRPLKGTLQGIALFGPGLYEDWIIENNIVAIDHWNGISLYGATDCNVVNNTVIKCPVYIVDSSPRTPWIKVDHGSAGSSSGNLVRNNLTADLANGSGIGTVDHNIETTSYTSHLVDYAGYDFHLKSGSSAIDAGSSTEAPSIDFEGDTRSSPPDVGADEYTTADGQVATPQFSPGGGTYSSTQSVAITSATSGASIRYTTDGSTPSQSNGSLYSNPISVSSTTTLKAIAYTSGMSDSTVASATYTISTSTGSYWTSVYPVSGGWELDPSGTKKAGLPPSWSPASTLSWHDYTSTQTVTDVAHTGTTEVKNGATVTFIRCKFTADGFQMGVQYAVGNNTYYTLQCSGGGTAILIDCEIYGGKSTCALFKGSMLRCYLAEGDDLIKTIGSVTLTECVLDGAKRGSSASHSDGIQSSTNSGDTTVHVLNAYRCWINAYNRRTDDLHNAAIQFGGYGSSQGGCDGEVIDSWLGGGNYTLNGSDTQAYVEFYGNRFDHNIGQGSENTTRFGVSAAGVSLGSTNVWDDTLEWVGQ